MDASTKSNATQNGSTPIKGIRFRSVAYPSNTILYCAGLTEEIFKIFGNVFATREAICKELGVSDSHIQTQLSSCVQYGLLELKSKEGYKITPLFTKIYKPLPSEKKEDALLEAFGNPELYKKIISSHNNESLTQNGLSIILFRNHKVSDGASKLAAKIFLENALDLGLYNSDNIFSTTTVTPEPEAEQVDIIDDGNHKEKPNTDSEVIYLPPSNNNVNHNKKFDHPPIPIFMDDGSVAELYLPKGFNKPDVERVIKVLRAQVE